MNKSQILALNDKAVIKILTKKYNYDKKEISGLRESSLEIRLKVLSNYFEELKDVSIEDLQIELSLSHASEKV